jgi:hypothetical protein
VSIYAVDTAKDVFNTFQINLQIGDGGVNSGANVAPDGPYITNVVWDNPNGILGNSTTNKFGVKINGTGGLGTTSTGGGGGNVTLVQATGAGPLAASFSNDNESQLYTVAGATSAQSNTNTERGMPSSAYTVAPGNAAMLLATVTIDTSHLATYGITEAQTFMLNLSDVNGITQETFNGTANVNTQLGTSLQLTWPGTAVGPEPASLGFLALLIPGLLKRRLRAG